MSDTKKLWPKPIPVLGTTGEFGSGKTLFISTISPGPRTLIYDTEKSSVSYEDLGFERVDVPGEMLKIASKRGTVAYKPVDTFEWWWHHVRKIEPGKYDVVALDTASEIESGAVDWVRTHPEYFSRTQAQYTQMSGLMWGDMKELWKSILSDIASRCQTFAFAVHMGEVWSGSRPTGKRKPKGKSTLMELASLFLQLERKPDAQGNVPVLPSALVLKSRLTHVTPTAIREEWRILPALPPRLPVATPAAVREYMLSPPDYAKLSKDEQAPEPVMSDDDRAHLRNATAETELELEKLRLEREQKQREVSERRQPTPAPNGQSPQPESADERVSEPQLDELRELIEQSGADVPKFLEHFRIKALAQIQRAKYIDAKRMLEKKIKQKSQPTPTGG